MFKINTIKNERVGAKSQLPCFSYERKRKRNVVRANEDSPSPPPPTPLRCDVKPVNENVVQWSSTLSSGGGCGGVKCVVNGKQRFVSYITLNS